MPERLRWGILGTGNIARQFSAGVAASQLGQLAAVGSRRPETAEAFARTYQIAAAYGTYQAVLDDPQVNAVYVSLPNSMHHEWTIRALRAAKHVLCEKPIAASAAQAQEMFDQAQYAGRALAEAFMYRAHPQTLAVMQAIRQGAIGTVKMIRSSFCYRTRKTKGNIRFNAELSGGALMDVGCYGISLARLVTGQEPLSVQAYGQLHASGVDEMAVGVMRFPDGVLSTFTCGMTVQADNTAYICGTDGYIEIPVPWKPAPRGATFTIAHSIPPRQDSTTAQASPAPPPRDMRTIDAGVDLYAIEADDFATAVLSAKPQRITPEDSVGNMRVLDEMRSQIGVNRG